MKRWIPVSALCLLLPASAYAKSFSTSTCCAVVDYTATNGFIWLSDGTDLSGLASGTTNGRITLTDSAGKIARGHIGNAGSGVTSVGGEILANAGFANWTGDDPDDYTVLNEDANNYVTESVGGGECRLVSNNTATVNVGQTAAATHKACYVWKIDITDASALSPRPRIRVSPGGNEVLVAYDSGWGVGDHDTYSTMPPVVGATHLWYQVYRNTGGNNDFTMDSWSVKRILTPGATGLYVVWSSVDAAFDYNDNSGYTVTIKKRGGAGPRNRVGRRMR